MTLTLLNFTLIKEAVSKGQSFYVVDNQQYNVNNFSYIFDGQLIKNL